jgi:cell division protein FtsW
MQRRTISILIAAVLILVTVGIVMLASASMVKGAAEAQFRNDPAYFVKRQIFWMLLSLIAAVVCVRVKLDWLKKIALPAAAVCVLLLIAVRIPGIGLNINGSWRWLRFGPFTVQPSEFAKIGIILSAAWWIARRRRYMHTFKRGILVPMLGLGLFAALLMAEPDFGTTLLTAFVVLALLYAGGVRPAYLFGFTAAGAAAFALLIFHNANRMRRIFAFLDPEKYAQEEAWQLINGLNAFAAGGVHGVGLGNSIQKYHYLPEAHTDFILPIIGEEFGLIATLSVLLLFVVIFICGLRIAAHASDDFGRFTALGCTLMITLQALINLAVVTGSMPTKGLALPFISYGGSSLLVSSAMVGILVNIAHASRDPKSKKRTELFKDRRRKA